MPSKFKALLKDLDINDNNTKRVNRPTEFNQVKDNIPLVKNCNGMCDLLFLPTAKFGYKYLFVYVDLASNLFDIQEIKNKEPSTVLEAMKKCFKRGIVKQPEFSIKTDSGNEFKGIFHKYLYDESIMHKTGLPYRHSSLSTVESLNRQLGKLFNLYMNKKEKESGKVFKNWTEFIPTVRKQLNEIRETNLPKDINSYVYPTPNDTKEIVTKKKGEIIYEKIKPKFKVGQYVYRYLDQSRNALNKKQNTAQRREGDINFDNIPREILKVFTFAGKGALYRYYLEGLPNVTFTEAQLRQAPNP